MPRSKATYKEVTQENAALRKVVLALMRREGLSMFDFDPVTVPRDQDFEMQEGRGGIVSVLKVYK